MANHSFLLQDPAGVYSNYTSVDRRLNMASNSRAIQGLIQVDTVAGSVEVQGRLSSEAPWMSLATYTESVLEAIILPYELRCIVTGGGKVYIGEVL